jgi:ADP-dependent NAD(P)H-hydrate dehydratase / NAD(P)H-hydrate epimerase
LTGVFAEAVKWINQSTCKVMSIDIPSGLQGEANSDLDIPIVKATRTFSLQFPKLAFLLPENDEFTGQWQVIDIGIHPQAIKETQSDLFYLVDSDIAPLLKKRPTFSHKGTFGHALIIAGSNGMAGASILSAKAALRSGAGLVTIYGPKCNRVIAQTTIPEVIFLSDSGGSDIIKTLPSIKDYSTIAIGPGIGTQLETANMLGKFMGIANNPCVIDADALNIISQHKELLRLIPKNSILTPHPKEFDRVFDTRNSSYERILKAQEIAKELQLIIILKGAYTLVATPNGQLYFNSTGNPGMATAGSGDVLTGILTGLLAQGYTPDETAKIGVFLHGRAGDLVLEKESDESLIASDIIDTLGKAFRSIKSKPGIQKS